MAIIPARGGSKSVPNKNIRELGGKPLIAWTIEQANKSKHIDRIILSSDDDKIINIAKNWGCEVPFKRPKEIARDDTAGIEPVIHALQTLQERYDYIVLLQPTSPLRKVEDIDRCIKLCSKKKAPSCVSITKPENNPFWMFTLDQDCYLKPLINTSKEYFRRQDIPNVYSLNGAVYVAETKWLLAKKTFISPETIGYIMPKERSNDIDDEIDFKFCEILIHQ